MSDEQPEWMLEAEGNEFFYVPYQDKNEKPSMVLFTSRTPERNQDKWGRDVWDWPVRTLVATDPKGKKATMSPEKVFRVRSKRCLRVLKALFLAQPQETVVKGKKSYTTAFLISRSGENMNTEYHGELSPLAIDLESGAAIGFDAAQALLDE